MKVRQQKRVRVLLDFYGAYDFNKRGSTGKLKETRCESRLKVRRHDIDLMGLRRPIQLLVECRNAFQAHGVDSRPHCHPEGATAGPL
jgi:hypothetical protein